MGPSRNRGYWIGLADSAIDITGSAKRQPGLAVTQHNRAADDRLNPPPAREPAGNIIREHGSRMASYHRNAIHYNAGIPPLCRVFIICTQLPCGSTMLSSQLPTGGWGGINPAATREGSPAVRRIWLVRSTRGWLCKESLPPAGGTHLTARHLLAPRKSAGHKASPAPNAHGAGYAPLNRASQPIACNGPEMPVKVAQHPKDEGRKDPGSLGWAELHNFIATVLVAAAAPASAAGERSYAPGGLATPVGFAAATKCLAQFASVKYWGPVQRNCVAYAPDRDS